MGRIQLLDDQLINKIAAGEVVERPASVVKELVENSLDAGATRITIELVEGGRKRILISDNGCGMDRDDAVMALKRHATSKICSDEDLFQLSTMGFRGEAIASIAAVSKFSLMTCEQGETEGVRVASEGEAQPDISSWQASGGTTVIVDELFFNVPVRAKFLKTASTEYGNVLELLQSLALAWPHVDFTLVHNGKEQLRAPPVCKPDIAAGGESLWPEEILRQRFKQIFKADGDISMVFASGESQYGNMAALVSAPGVERGTGRDIYMFVNGRFVKDKGLRYAVLRGYHSHLLKGKYPVAVVFLKLDPGLVDVNVHPSKTEVRLQFPSELQGMIATSIREVLRKASWSSAAEAPESFPFNRAGGATHPVGLTADNVRPEVGSDSRTGDASAPSRANFSGKPAIPTRFAASPFEASIQGGPSHNSFASSLFAEPQARHLPVNQDLAPSIPWDELTYMGAVADCYLLFSHGTRRSGSRLLALDQHAFHERIIYERLCNNADLLRSSQTLLVPEVFSFGIEQIEALKEQEALLRANGFRVAFVSDTLVELHAVPVLLAKANAEPLLLAFAKRAHSAIPLENNSGLGHEILSTMACHAAVRAGESLGENELKALLAEAADVDFFHNCPHGRRVFRWWDEGQIGRWFDR